MSAFVYKSCYINRAHFCAHMLSFPDIFCRFLFRIWTEYQHDGICVINVYCTFLCFQRLDGDIERIKYLKEDEPFCLRRLTGEFINYKLGLNVLPEAHVLGISVKTKELKWFHNFFMLCCMLFFRKKFSAILIINK